MNELLEQINKTSIFRLGDISEVRRGSSPRPIHNYISKQGMPWLKIADVTSIESRFVKSTKEFIKNEGIKNSVVVNPGDLILSNSATPGIPKFLGITACIHDGWLLIKPNNNIIDKNYLYYKLLTIRKILKNSVSGAIFDNLKTDIIKDFEVRIPNLQTQKKIAEILSAYDEKIENNNKIIKNLELTAQTIFNEWFVNFRFPGHEKAKMVESEMGEIPEGWEVKSVLDVIERITVGKKFENKTASIIGKVPILDQGASGFIGYHNEEPGVEASIENPVVVFTNHTCYYRLLTEPFSCIQNVLPYIGKNGYKTLFVYFLTKEKIKMSEYKGHWPEFEQQVFVIPHVELADAYASKIESFISEMVVLEKEKVKLKESRDQLLAKLI